MRLTKKHVITELQDVEILEITEQELLMAAADVCTSIVVDDDIDLDAETRINLSLAYAQFSAKLIYKLFNKESEDK